MAALHKPITTAWADCSHDDLKLLLILRSKAPSFGLWSFPGGRLELGEGMLTAAKRELHEETQVVGNSIFGDSRDIFHVSEAIVSPSGEYLSGAGRQTQENVAFHYVLPHVAVLCSPLKLEASPDTLPCATPSDDAAACAWLSVRALLGADPAGGPLVTNSTCCSSLPTAEFEGLQVNPAHPACNNTVSKKRQHFVRGLPHVVSKLLTHLSATKA